MFIKFFLIADGQCLFKAFLQREFSEENIEFWLAVEEFKNLKSAKLQSKAQKIHDDFIAIQSPKEVSKRMDFRILFYKN